MDLSVIIVNYNTKNLIKNCLKSIFQALDGLRYEIIIIDNASTDGSAKLIKKRFPDVCLIKNKKNSGFARACNQGAKIARGKILFFLNPDSQVRNKIFSKVFNFLRENPRVAIVSPLILSSDYSVQPFSFGKETGFFQTIKNKFNKKSLKTNNYPGESLEVDWVSGAALTIRRDIFEKIGGFDEKFFMYFEDRDLCWRVRNLGYKIVILANAKIVHLGGRSLVSHKTRKRLYYQSQNYYWQKHHGLFRGWLMRLLRWPYKFYILNLKK